MLAADPGRRNQRAKGPIGPRPPMAARSDAPAADGPAVPHLTSLRSQGRGVLSARPLLASTPLMQVLVYPNPLLRRGSVDVTAFDAKLAETARSLFDAMYAEKGVGLAAPQVGLQLNLLVLNPAGELGHPEEEKVLVNPKIEREKGREFGEEGCLSFPGIYGDVERATEITVAYLDEKGAPQKATYKDFLARIIQHEMDHLRGVLFVDRFTPADKVRIKPRLAELERRSGAPA